jgi:hypothetical protein
MTDGHESLPLVKGGDVAAIQVELYLVGNSIDSCSRRAGLRQHRGMALQLAEAEVYMYISRMEQRACIKV